jgi:hypothetical protein
VLAGKSTLNRLEHAPAEGAAERYHKISHDGGAMAALFVKLFLQAHRSPPRRLILDLDATVSERLPLTINVRSTIRSTAIRRTAFSMATTNVTASCRFTFSAATNCSWPSCAPRT